MAMRHAHECASRHAMPMARWPGHKDVNETKLEPGSGVRVREKL